MEEGHVSSFAAVPSITASQSSWGSLVHSTSHSRQDNGIICGGEWRGGGAGEAAPGRGSGGGAFFHQSIPRHPMSACGAWGRVAEGTLVACGWQGLASLIQLAGPPPSLHNSGPAGAELWAAALCAPSPCIWIQFLALPRPPLLAPAALSAPPTSERKQPWTSPKSWETVWLLVSPMWLAECEEREQEGPVEGGCPCRILEPVCTCAV